MALRVRLDPIATTLRVMVGDTATVQGQQKVIANFARSEIEKVDVANARALGRKVAHVTSVDGRKGATLETVRPNGGVIETLWDIGTVDVLPWIMRELVSRSPRISGEYIRGHRVFMNGVEVALTESRDPSAEYVVLNVVPYARKVEIGKTEAGRAFVIQVPNRIYERVAKDARARFGKVADIRFSYRETTKAYRLRGSNRSPPVRAPAIIVRMKDTI